MRAKALSYWGRQPQWLRRSIIALLFFIALASADWDIAAYGRNADEQTDYENPSLFSGPLFSFLQSVWDFVGDNHDALLAVFTILIFIVTSLLAKYTYSLWNETKTLREDATKDADQRRKDMLASERAYIFLENVTLSQISAAWTSTNNEGTRAYRELDGIRFTFTNHGRTPGEIIEWSADLKVCNSFAESHQPIPAELTSKVVGVHGSELFPLPMREIDASAYDAAESDGYFPCLLFFGLVNYVDFVGDRHVTRFSWIYDFARDRFSPSLDRDGNRWT